jgi:DNA repair protein RecO (recombination protein O)
MIQRSGEAIVLRTWPFLEADLLVSLFTREQGRIKGVARHAMRSRRRFGGALEPMTCVRASYAERPRQPAGEELVRLDAFEILSSPLSRPIDYARTAALQLFAETLEEALPEQAPDDPIFRLVLSVLEELRVDNVWLPVLYFALWMDRLMGWMPELARCVVCGEYLRGRTLFYSKTSDGITCEDHRRPGSFALSAESAALAERIFRSPLHALATQVFPRNSAADLRRFAFELLERHLERRLASARTLNRLAFSSAPREPIS